MAYQRTTQDYYSVRGYYAGAWEEVTAEDTYKEAKGRLKEYQDNEPLVSFKIVTKQEKIRPLLLTYVQGRKGRPKQDRLAAPVLICGTLKDTLERVPSNWYILQQGKVVGRSAKCFNDTQRM